MKKLFACILVVSLVLSLLPMAALGYQIGDVINFAQPTNIVASINGYQLMSYNVDGYTYIVVEDLRYYGFDVVYDNATRTLSVSRSNATEIDPPSKNPEYNKIGANTIRRNILYTDIVTYVNNAYVPSCNIDGLTIINFNTLASFGAASYDNDRREISLEIEDLNHNEVDLFARDLAPDVEAELQKLYEDSFSKAYGVPVSATCLLRARGNILVTEIYLHGITLTPQQKANEQNAMIELQPELQKSDGVLQEICAALTGTTYYFYDDSGECFGQMSASF